MPIAIRIRKKRQARCFIETLESRGLMSVTAAPFTSAGVHDLAANGTVLYKKPVSDQELKDELQSLADAYGWTIRVTSGDRTTVPPGGSSTSHHLVGRGADFHVDGLSDDQVFQDLRSAGSLANDYQVIEHGQYAKPIPPHVHIGRFDDGRPSQFLTQGLTKKKPKRYTSVGPIILPPAPTPAPAPTPTPTAVAPVIDVGPRSLSFTAKEGSTQSDNKSTFSVGNLGPAGSVLTYSLAEEQGGKISYSGQISPALAPDQQDNLTLTYNTTGLTAGDYHDAIVITSNDPNSPSERIQVTITIATATVKYQGLFTGHVQNSDSDSQDPDGSFVDSYSGPATVGVTPNPGGGYSLQFSATLSTSQPHAEDFSTSPNGTVTASDLGKISFTFDMGDGKCQVQGGIANGVFSGKWTFVQSNSSDMSDSGSGTFSLHLV